MTDFAQLKTFSDRLGPVYGTEDFAIFLYSLIRMQKPSVLLELGTGAGVAALWMAMALKENGSGQLWTLDNGSHWDTIKTNENYPFSAAERALSYTDYVAQKCQQFGVEAQLTLLNQSAPPLPDPGKKIDLLFADFEHDPGAIIRLLSFYLPRLSDCASVFVDSATTYFPSYAYLENLIPILNRGEIPRSWIPLIEPERLETAKQYVRSSNFQLVHLTESKDRRQNSTAWLRISPLDTQPYPVAKFHV